MGDAPKLPKTWRGLSLRARLILLVLACMLPVLALALGLQYLAYRNEVAHTTSETLERAHSMIRLAEQELERRITALQVLSQSAVLQLTDLTTFRVRAAQVVDEMFPGENIVVLQQDGRVLMTTQGAVDQVLPVRANMATTSRVFASGKPGVSDLFAGHITGRPVVAVDVPLKNPEGTVVAVLSINPRLEVFADILRQQDLSAGWIASIVDTQGVSVARAPHPEQFVGKPISDRLMKRLQQQSEGIVENISREGIPLRSVFSHGSRFGWAVTMGVPSATLTGPAFAAAAQILAASLAVFAIGAALATLVARQITRPIAMLQRLAGAADHDQLLDPPPTGLREADAVAQALRTAELERRHIEAQERDARGALRASEESFNYLFDHSPLPKWVHEPATLKFLAVNQAAINVYGYSREEFLAMSLVELWPEDERQRMITLVRTGPDHLHSGDWHHRYKDGRLVDIETFAHALIFDGKPARMVVILDVTARKAAEAQLVQAQKMEAVGQLTGGMAHDFNNLLGVILGNLGLLQDGGRHDPDFDEFVLAARRAAQRGADLTRSLLAFARRQPLQPARVEVNNLVSEMTALLRRTLGERIEIGLDLAPHVWPVRVDPAQLESALANLATNARDAMPRGGRLSIATANRQLDAEYASHHDDVAPGDYVLLQVSDSGIGMAREVLAKVFEPFFTTKPRGQGTGLGLSMVFGFIKQSGGHINVYSEVGVGTTFRLYMPRVQAAAEDVVATAPSTVPRGAGQRILVVEDEPAMRRVVVRQLEQLGYRPVEADSGTAALAALEADGPFDLLFTDIVMAGRIDGFDLARLVVARWPDIKIVMTSGFPDAKTCDDTVALTNLQLLSKPYLRADLARMLHRVLTERADAGA